MTNWVVIYTTSAFHCPWCVKAKELLNVYGYDFYEKDIATVPRYKDEFREKGHTKVPQIWIEDELIGGHDALQEWLRRNTAGAKKEISENGI
jgi:glutaredoxin 3